MKHFQEFAEKKYEKFRIEHFGCIYRIIEIECHKSKIPSYDHYDLRIRMFPIQRATSYNWKIFMEEY